MKAAEWFPFSPWATGATSSSSNQQYALNNSWINSSFAIGRNQLNDYVSILCLSSNLHYWKTREIGTCVVSSDYVLGYKGAGEVVFEGSNVTISLLVTALPLSLEYLAMNTTTAPLTSTPYFENVRYQKFAEFAMLPKNRITIHLAIWVSIGTQNRARSEPRREQEI